MKRTFTTLTLSGLVLLGATTDAQARSDKEREEITAMLLQAQKAKKPKPFAVLAEEPMMRSMSIFNDSSAKLSTELALARMEVKQQITPETTDLFGDRVDLNSGSVSFEHVDVSLRGNNELPVEIRRTYWGSKNNFANNLSFGDWNIAIPSITTTTMEYDSRLPSKPKVLSHLPNCGELPPSYVDTQFATVGAKQYWSGDTLDIPGVTNQKLRQGGSGMNPRQADNWKVTCLSDRYGFEAVSPEGVTYTFDVVSLTPSTYIPVNQEADIFNPDYDAIELMRTYTLNVQVSRIEDRFGNWVDYNYDAAVLAYGMASNFISYSNKLTSIESSDGREINISYENGSGGERVSSISADGKTWSYDYTTRYDGIDELNKDVLIEVTRPDSKSWTFDLAFHTYGGFIASTGTNDCGSLSTTSKVSTITHPEGAVYTLTQRPTQFGMSQIPQGSSRCFSNLAVIKKELDFNLQTLTWNYSYSQNAGSPKHTTLSTPQPAALSGLPFTPTGYALMDLRSTTVVNPDGSKTLHAFNRSHTPLEGKEVATYWFDTNTSTLLRSQVTSFTQVLKAGDVRLESCKPNVYPLQQQAPCYNHEHFANNDLHNYHAYPNVQTTKSHDGGVATTFTTTYSNYNAYGKPLLTHEQSSNGSRYIRQTYQHDTTQWIINLPTKTEVSSNNSTWTTVNQQSYYSAAHASNLLPYQSTRYGQLQKTSTYHSSGLLKRETLNAPGRYVEFNNYVRGIPTQILIPKRYTSGSETASQTVNTRGEVTSVANFNGHTTSYGYDVLGRVTSITPPSPWTATTITYTSSGDTFIQTLTRGSYQKRIEMDALFRPILTRERDTSLNINRYFRQSFNAYNKPTFTSYPSASSAASTGMVSTYDGLQRPRLHYSNVDSSGTEHTYLSGNRVRVEDARGNLTTTTYRSFGAPEQELPTLIEQPHGVTTSLTYSLFDQPVTISQGGQTETRRYDAQQRLCRLVRADVGHTAYAYNALGDITWEAPGASGSSSACNATSVLAAEKINYTYDNVGNVRQQSFSDTSGTRTHTYDAQGQLTQLTSGSTSWAYTYNSLGLVESETLAIDSFNFVLNQGYNTAGHLTSLVYPSGRTVSFSPNAFGEARQAGVYASQAVYHPNGQLASYQYGNGLSFSQTMDSKQRPYVRTISDGAALLKQTYSYDDNHNITSIIDGVTSGNSVTGLVYDNLDRLIEADGYWGQGTFSYDTLGNITSKQLGSQSLSYTYNSQKKLTGVSGSVSRTFTYDTRGNVTNNGQRSFTYNRAGRLASSGTADYQYDGHGRRISKNIGGAKSYSLYSIDGQLLSSYKSGGYTDYFYLGKNLVAQYQDPNAQTDPVGYTGHLRDDTLNLSYMQQRYYDPVIGRFYSNDPLGFSAESPMMFNRFAYAFNNPLKFVDPDGRSSVDFNSLFPQSEERRIVNNMYNNVVHAAQEAPRYAISSAGTAGVAIGQSTMRTSGDIATVTGLIPGGQGVAAFFSVLDLIETGSISALGGLAAGESTAMLMEKHKFGETAKFLVSVAVSARASEGIESHEKSSLNQSNSILNEGSGSVPVYNIEGRLDSLNLNQELEKQ
ncbi:RHS repeat domain-containing protein [Pseudidiomarina aestuarii]|uniref:RHS repeat domain-containing protein n=1 Tax=Pseudidiomarina aestuarii TaxID=624146 RepID=UPI003A97572A